MRIFGAICLYLLIAITILQNWLFLAAGIIILFSIQFGAATLIPLAILTDGYFGNFSSFPYLSSLAIVWYLLIEYIRPLIINK